MKPAVRFILGFLFVVFCLLAIKVPSFAQTTTTPQPNQAVNNYVSPNTDSNVPTNLHTWTQTVMIEVMSAMSCQLAGVDPTNPNAKCLGVDQKTGKIGFVENGGGAIGAMSSLISMTFTMPIHTHDYIAYVTKSFGITKSAYAAGEQTGFNSLSPIMNIWIAFRNIVYLLFVLIFIVIGIAIMLRVKIDPRTVMTVQNQIPKIIIGIVLVTFSFAIAGLLIDVMWLAIYLFINVLTSTDPKMAADAGKLTANLNSTTLYYANTAYNGPLGGLVGIASGASSSISSIIFNLFTQSGAPATSASWTDIIGGILTGAVGFLLGGFLSAIGGILAFFIIVIALLWSLIRLWFALISAYVFILVDVIFAPFWIVTGLLPGGQSLGFSAWLRDMLGNLAAFPTTIAMFLIGRLLIDAFGGPYQAGQFNPPLLGNPLAGGTNVLGPLIALGIIFTTPHIVNITKAAFKAPKIDLGPVGQAIGVGAAAPGRLVGGGLNAAFGTHYDDAQKTMVQKKGPIGTALRAFGVVH